MTSIRIRSRLPVALLLSGLLAATFTLFEPAKSAVSNWSEIVIGFAELLTRLAVPFAIAFFAIATLAVLLVALAPRRGLPVLVALYVALWAQGNLFVWEYGAFDGSPIDWTENSGKGFLELVTCPPEIDPACIFGFCFGSSEEQANGQETPHGRADHREHPAGRTRSTVL